MTAVHHDPTRPNPELRGTADERLDTVIATITRHAHAVAEEVGLTTKELLAGLDWLGRTAASSELHQLADVIGLSALVDEIEHRASGLDATSNIPGPWYLPDAPEVASGASIVFSAIPGDPLTVTGTVRDRATHQPVKLPLLDIWQTDGDGLYDRDRPETATGNLRAVVRGTHDGSYSFSSVTPASYSISMGGPTGELLQRLRRSTTRPAHIHFKVRATGYRELTTMIFIDGDPWLQADAVYAVKPDLIVGIDRTQPQPTLRADFELVPE